MQKNERDYFSQTYAQAREKFLAAARRAEGSIQSYAHPDLCGAQGEELAMDVTRIGRADAHDMLILTSATHGVEGFCGSGCQIALLDDASLVKRLRDGKVSVLMIHAINPFGFSWIRRTNEDNVDLNRNFLDHAYATENTAYAEIHHLLLPETWPPSPENQGKIDHYIETHGHNAFQLAVSGGQYQFPDGMFYGGTKPTWSNRTLRRILREHGAGKKRIGWIDFHTGLGPCGFGEKIYAGLNTADDIARARTWWGNDVVSTHDGSSVSARLQGVVRGAVYDECPHVEFSAIGMEYGTTPLTETLHSLRAEHWLQNHPEASSAQRKAIKQGLRDAFYVDTDDWKRLVLKQAREVSVQALDVLESNPGSN